MREVSEYGEDSIFACRRGDETEQSYATARTLSVTLRVRYLAMFFSFLI